MTKKKRKSRKKSGLPDLASLALGLAVVLVAAFLISFARGLGWPDWTGTDPASDTADARARLDEERRGRINVLNATDRNGLAADVTDRLRDAGFDVVHYGNADDTDPDSSVVIDRIGDDAIARAVAGELGIDRITTDVDSTLYLDATVVLGVDFQLRGR